jgi:hypothetical protein
VDPHQASPQPNLTALELLEQRYQELLRTGDQWLRQWRLDLDRLGDDTRASHDDERSPAKKLDDPQEDLELLQNQLHQAEEELEYYFLRYREGLQECAIKDEKIEELARQQAWMQSQLNKQQALLSRLMVVMTRLCE